MKIQLIEEIKVKVVEVDVAERCPNCEADLTEEGALTLWEYQDQARGGQLDAGCDNGLDFDPESDVESGESFLCYSEAQCAACGRGLAEGKERKFVREEVRG